MVTIEFAENRQLLYKADIKIKGNTVETLIKDDSIKADGYAGDLDVIEKLAPYNSYALVIKNNGTVKTFKKNIQSNIRWLDLNRMGYANHFDFSDIISLNNGSGKGTLMQLDTGIIRDDYKEIFIRVFKGNKENFTITSDEKIKYGTFDANDQLLPTPRHFLWDCYSLKVNDEEFMADRNGKVFSGRNPMTIKAGEDLEYISFKVGKYNSDFTKKLTRDIDDDEITVESTAGMLNAQRVYLQNGEAEFRLYPLGYRGKFKIKLGHRWFSPWCEYNFIMVDK